jgi:hypothetical protein
MANQIENPGPLYVDSLAIKLPTAGISALSDITLETESQYRDLVGWTSIEALFPESGEGAVNIAAVVGCVIALIHHCAAIGESPVVISGDYTYAVPAAGGWTIYATAMDQNEVLKLTGDATLSAGSRVYTRLATELNAPIYLSSLIAIAEPPFWTRHIKTYETV